MIRSARPNQPPVSSPTAYRSAVPVSFAQLMVATESDALPDVCWLGITHIA